MNNEHTEAIRHHLVGVEAEMRDLQQRNMWAEDRARLVEGMLHQMEERGLCLREAGSLRDNDRRWVVETPDGVEVGTGPRLFDAMKNAHDNDYGDTPSCPF